MNTAARMDETTEKMWKASTYHLEAPSRPLFWMMLFGMLSKASSTALVMAYI